MDITSTAQLEQAIMDRIENAMNVSAPKMEADAYEEVGLFYTQGNPKMYIRTGALGSTPRVTSVNTSGKTVSFDVYLDQSHDYSTGTWDMPTVMTNAESGSGGILGKPGFWASSKDKFRETLHNVMSSFFN